MHPDGDLATMLASAVSRLAREIQSGRLPDLSVSEMSILAVLAGSEASSPAELAVTERMRPPSVTRHLKSMAARGLITLEPHAGDRRRVRVTITDAGREVLGQAREAAWLAARLKVLTEADRNTLRAAVPVLDGLGR